MNHTQQQIEVVFNTFLFLNSCYWLMIMFELFGIFHNNKVFTCGAADLTATSIQGTPPENSFSPLRPFDKSVLTEKNTNSPHSCYECLCFKRTGVYRTFTTQCLK